jgi:hypothetical protein
MISLRENRQKTDDLDFFLGTLAVGYFAGETYPSADGEYRYEPYRGSGHLQLMNSLKKNCAQRCHFISDRKIYYFTVLSCPEHGVLELAEFDTPKPVVSR